MDECCCPPPETATKLACPTCLQTAGRVEAVTVKALLRPEALGRITLAGFYFCPGSACDTVYFSEGQVFRTGDLSVDVWQKQPAGRRTFCYCFGENEAEMRAELQTTGRINAVERVRHHIAERRCACDIKNPRGTCCLGELGRAVQRIVESKP